MRVGFRQVAALNAIAILCLSIPSAGTAAPVPALPFIDAHSHLVPSVAPDAEIALFRAAGMAGVAIMAPDWDIIYQLSLRHPGVVFPFASIRNFDDEAGPALDRLKREGRICGFGDVRTRLQPNPEPSDAAAISNRVRGRIFDASAATGTPVTVHVSLETPEVIAAIERVVASRPRMRLILGHAGWVAGPELMGRLMHAHPNIYADLSVRLDPSRSDGLSILQPDGHLPRAWREVMERFPDRFLFATDVTGTNRHQRIVEFLSVARKALGTLPDAVQHQIAHGNFQRLFSSCGVPPVGRAP